MREARHWPLEEGEEGLEATSLLALVQELAHQEVVAVVHQEVVACREVVAVVKQEHLLICSFFDVARTHLKC